MPESTPWEKYEAALDEARELSLRENRMIKSGDFSEYAKLLAQKHKLLEQLDEGLNFLRTLSNLDTAARNRQKILQDKIMKLLLLDRENEELLGKRG